MIVRLSDGREVALDEETFLYLKLRLNEGWNNSEVLNELLSWEEHEPGLAAVYVLLASRELAAEKGSNRGEQEKEEQLPGE